MENPAFGKKKKKKKKQNKTKQKKKTKTKTKKLIPTDKTPHPIEESKIKTNSQRTQEVQIPTHTRDLSPSKYQKYQTQKN